MAFNSPEDEWSARLGMQLNDRMFKAVADGHLEQLKSAIKAGADATADRSKALRLAAGQGQTEMVGVLLNAGADVAALDHAALRAAAKSGHVGAVSLLLGKKSDPNAGEGEALIDAADKGRIDIVNLLLSYGADPHADEDLALRKASFHGHFEVVRALVQNNADVFALYGSALSLARADKHDGIVTYLSVTMHDRREDLRAGIAAAGQDVGAFLRTAWHETSGHDTRESALVRSLKVNLLEDALKALVAAGDGLTISDMTALKDRSGRSFLQLAAERGQLKKIFDSKNWPDRFDDMVACWDKLAPDQRRQGAMNADDFAHLMALRHQETLKAQARDFRLKPKPPKAP